jgi:hypothetical protein
MKAAKGKGNHSMATPAVARKKGKKAAAKKDAFVEKLHSAINAQAAKMTTAERTKAHAEFKKLLTKVRVSRGASS